MLHGGKLTATSHVLILIIVGLGYFTFFLSKILCIFNVKQGESEITLVGAILATILAAVRHNSTQGLFCCPHGGPPTHSLFFPKNCQYIVTIFNIMNDM